MSSLKVLVVEDEMLVATDIQESLELLGYNVLDTVATGPAAIEAVENDLPDVILIHIILNGHMKGKSTITVGHGTDEGKAVCLLKRVLSTTSDVRLFVRVRIEDRRGRLRDRPLGGRRDPLSTPLCQMVSPIPLPKPRSPS